jgi:hypothetical protein
MDVSYKRLRIEKMMRYGSVVRMMSFPVPGMPVVGRRGFRIGNDNQMECMYLPQICK